MFYNIEGLKKRMVELEKESEKIHGKIEACEEYGDYERAENLVQLIKWNDEEITRISKMVNEHEKV